MRFGERDLQSYAQPVATGSLREGRTYFSVQYIDDAMIVPIVETLVFIGKNLDGEDTGLLYFQDVESYWQGIRRGSTEAAQAKFQLGSEGTINHIFEYDSALDELMKCSLRRAEGAGV